MAEQPLFDRLETIRQHHADSGDPGAAATIEHAKQTLLLLRKAERRHCREIKKLRSMIDAGEQSQESVNRLARAIDVAMHGEENAAPQAALCDLVSPASRLRQKNEYLRAALRVMRGMDTGPDRGAQSVADYALSDEVAPT